jgi:hypothetical protein
MLLAARGRTPRGRRAVEPRVTRVWARVYSSTPSLALRCAWNVGDRTHGLITPASQVALPSGAGAASVDMLYLQPLDEAAGMGG